MTVLRYAYDQRTGAFVGQIEAQESPLEPGVILEPAFSTPTEPPAASAKTAARWTGVAWTIMPDHRGEVWFSGMAPTVVDFLGDPAAHNLTAEPVLPPPPPPSSCSKLGLMRAFKARGLWETVRAMIASNADMAEEWALAIEIQKSDPLIQVALAGLAQQGIAMSDADVDKLIADAVAAVAAQPQAA
jgi:hypothetical protein